MTIYILLSQLFLVHKKKDLFLLSNLLFLSFSLPKKNIIWNRKIWFISNMSNNLYSSTTKHTENRTAKNG